MFASAESNKFKDSAKAWGVALLTTVFMVANANAADPKLQIVEPSSTDLSKPFTTPFCVKTTPGQPGLSAWDKLLTVMNARGQMIAGEGNQVVTGQNSRQVSLVSISNNFSGKEGYIISGDVPNANRTQSPGFCLTPSAFSIAIDNKASSGVPDAVNTGELGVGLRNHDKAGTKAAVVGISPTGSLFAVIFNPATNKGVIYTSDVTGNKATPIAALEDFDYSTKMKKHFALVSAEKANEKPNLVAGVDPRALLTRAPE